MSTIHAFIKRHPVLTYYVLTFAISSGGVLLVIGGPGGIPATAEQFERLLPIAIPVQLAGPSVAGLLLTGLVYGRVGFRDLFSRLLRWRVAARWYTVALLTAPLVFAVVHLALSLVSPVFLPGLVTTDNKAAFLVSGFVGALVVGFLEELGWTGFAIPPAEVTLRCPCHRAHRRRAVGSVAPASARLLGSQDFLRGTSPGPDGLII
jgi:membrane protease YdiL (CAAX protease family)